jgi:DNA primase
MKSEKPDITAILEYYGGQVMTRHGWSKMKCPFHEDSHASAAVNLSLNVFKCHGCQMKGDGYGIVMQREGVGFIEAISITERILNQSGKALPQRTTRGGGLPRRTGNHSGAGNQGAVGRRARALNRA